jgi:hypothetical protein
VQSPAIKKESCGLKQGWRKKKGRMYSIEIIRQISAVHLGRGEDGDSVVYLTTVYQILMVWGLRGSGFNADV